MTPHRRLSPTRRIGPWRIAALEEWSVSAWARDRSRVGGGATLQPLALLIHGPAGTVFRTPSGSPLTATDIDGLLPGACADFAKNAKRDTLSPEEEEEDPC